MPWKLYENGYLLFKPVPGKDTLTSIDRSENALAPSWKRHDVKAIGFTDKVYLPEDSSDLFANSTGQNIGGLSAEFLDASKIDTSRVKNMFSMFNSSSFAKLDLNTWNTSNVENMKSMFFNTVVTELKIDKWDTSKVKNMSLMFERSTSLKELNIQDWNTSNVEDMNSMFDYAVELRKLDLNKWNVSKVKDMTTMFANLPNLENLKISNWNTSNVESMAAMFEDNAKLKELDISNWNTSKVKDMTLMFTLMHNLEKLDLGKWDTSNVEKMNGMFVDTFKLRYLDITNFDTSKVNDLEHMFSNSGLIKLKIGDKFAKTQLKDGLFDSLDFEYIGELLRLGQKYGNKWTRLDKTTPFYTVEEWNKVFRENPEKLAGIWVREKKFREDVRKIVDEEDKEVKESELGNYTEPNEEPDGVTVDKIPIYKVQKITTTYKGDESLDKGQQVVEKDGKEDGNRVVRVGTKATVEVEKIPSPVRYEKDNTREKGQENITVKGKDGSKTTTTTYTVNNKTGEVVPNVGKPVVVDPTETVIKVASKDKVSVEKLPSPVRYEKDNTREKGQENITVKGKDGSKTTTTTYTVNPKTGEVVENVGKPVVVDPTETVVKVAAKDKVEVVNKKDGETVKVITSYEVNPKTGELKEVKRDELLSKKGIPEVSEESTDFKGGVNPTESIVREDLPELKVALIKDGDGNVLEVIKEDEKPKDIQGYKNTGKTETDKDGHKVYVYEKVEDKQESPEDKKEETEKPKTEEKVVNKDKEDKKEVISKKEELPKTSASMLSTVGLFSIFGLRKNRRKDKK